MDSYKFDNLQAEKAKAIRKYRQLRKITNYFRFVEVCVVLILISRLSIKLPVAVKNSSEYFRDVSGFMVSPRFVFLIGNVIIITLFAQAGHFSAQGSKSNISESDLYQEFIQNSSKNLRIEDQIKFPEKQSIKTEDVIKNEKLDTVGENTKCTEKKIINNHKNEGEKINFPENPSINNRRMIREQRKLLENHSKRMEQGKMIQRIEEIQIKKPDNKNSGLFVKDYRRSHSEILSRVQYEKPCRVLQRSETQKNRASLEIVAAEEVGRTSYPEDNMSNDEFRRTVEAFIARQQWLRRQEEHCII